MLRQTVASLRLSSPHLLTASPALCVRAYSKGASGTGGETVPATAQHRCRSPARGRSLPSSCTSQWWRA